MYENKTPRMRTIPQAYEEIKSADPNTAITLLALRRMVKDGTIPSVHVASKQLVNLDAILEYWTTGKTPLCVSQSEKGA